MFWAAAWRNKSTTPPRPGCNYTAPGAFFTFWSVRTTDFAQFTEPEPLFNPGCMTPQLAPWTYSEGGIDGGMVVDDAGAFHLFYKDTSAPRPGLPFSVVQGYSGTRTVSAPTIAGLHSRNPRPHAAPGDKRRGLLGDNDTEGPEVVVVNGTMHLYYDCTFHPTPKGWDRPPYGLATAPHPAGFTDPAAWAPAPGSCTGADASPLGVAFPNGATHGGFTCVQEAEYQRLLAGFPPAAGHAAPS